MSLEKGGCSTNSGFDVGYKMGKIHDGRSFISPPLSGKEIYFVGG